MPTKKRGSLATNSAIYLLASIFSAATPFLLIPVLTRYLTPGEYGEVALFQSFVAGLGAVVGLCVHGAANRKFFDPPADTHEMKHFMGACLQILFVSSTIVGALLYLTQEPLSAGLGLQPCWFAGALAVSLGGFITNLRLGQWQVRGQALQFGLFQGGQAITSLALALLAVVALRQGAEGRIWALIITTLGFAALSLALLGRDGLVGMSWRPAYIRDALSFGVPLVPHIAGIFLLGMADRFLIGRELGMAPVGVYMVAAQVAMMLALLADAINKAYVPWLFERLQRNDPVEKCQIVRNTYLYFGCALLLAGAMAVFGPLLIRLLAGEGYEAAGELVGWLALGQAFGGMYMMVTNYMFYSKKTGGLSLVTIGSGTVNILLIIMLIPVLGLSGVAIAYCLSMGLRFLLTWGLAQKNHPMPWLSFKTYS